MSFFHDLRWSHGAARVLSTAAMLADCRFVLPGGAFSPFARAPWMGTLDDPAIPGHLRELGGEFACVPFGGGGPFVSAPDDWAGLMQRPPEEPTHGPAGDAEWELVEASEDGVTLGLDYPEASPVRRLERRISAMAGEPGLMFSLTIFARRRERISVGLHPILKLPERPGALRLEAAFAFGLVHPSQMAAGQRQEFSGLSAVPQPQGLVDFTHVPFGVPKEANLQLCGMGGPVTATYVDERAGVVLDWDRDLLPSLQIWHTDRAIEGAPWHSRYRGIGLEPIAAAFDLQDSVSVGPNLINARGVATAVEIDPARPVVIGYSVRAFGV